MKTKLLSYILLIASIVGICACDVEFNPNSQWKETTIVYCLLDQDADTTFVRVEKAFLGEGNYLDFAKIKDSIYYKEDEIDVKLFSFYKWDIDLTSPIDTIQFIYTADFLKPSGDFFNDIAPVYYAITRNKIQINRLYKLEVRNLKSGNLVYSTTQPLGNYEILQPDQVFSFKYEKGIYKMTIQWENINQTSNGMMPKMFQIVFRFHYQEKRDGAFEETFIDLPVGNVVNTFNSPHNLSHSVALDALISAVKVRLNNGKPKKWSDKTEWMELYLKSCDVQMYDYININKTSNNLLTDRPFFTNIENGIGLFAARRTYIKQVFSDYRSYGGRFASSIKEVFER